MCRKLKPMDDKLLIELWPTFLPERILEIRLGRHSSAIYRRARVLGLPLRIPLRDRLYGVTPETFYRRERKARRNAQIGPAGKDCHA